MQAPTFVDYRGSGTLVRLDLAGGCLTIEHGRASRHTGTLVVPINEVVDIRFKERQGFKAGWAQVITATHPHPDDPATDPYSWRTGADHVTAFCYLVVTVSRLWRHEQVAVVHRDVISEEISEIRQQLNELRGE